MKNLIKILPIIVILFSSKSISQQMNDSTFLEMVQRKSFDFFWMEANSNTGLIKDRTQTWAPSSIASVGFGLTSICIGVDNNWISRDAARDRVLTTLQTLWNGPQHSGATSVMGYKGFFYHFLNMSTGYREWTSELSTIDSGLLLAGVIYVQQYFNQNETSENNIRALADSIYRRVDWKFAMNYYPTLRMEWSPEKGFSSNGWIGYNEAMIMYILALGSPTYSIDADSWTAWTSGYNWSTYYGLSYVIFPPLFGHQYSHCWIDFRLINDTFMKNKGITYFENSRRATLANREYCIQNPKGHAGYGPNVWGLTASDYPNGYIARGAPPAENDEGTIAPTAAGGSIPFAPEVCIPTLKYMYDTYKNNLWGAYGFKDAFNIGKNWWGTDYIGIDQGPIVLMIENYKNNKVWDKFMQSPYIQAGLKKAGFTNLLDVNEEKNIIPTKLELFQNYPNPFNSSTTINFNLPNQDNIKIEVFDVLGKSISVIADENMKAGNHTFNFNSNNISSGVYYYSLKTSNTNQFKSMHLLK